MVVLQGAYRSNNFRNVMTVLPWNVYWILIWPQLVLLRWRKKDVVNLHSAIRSLYQ